MHLVKIDMVMMKMVLLKIVLDVIGLGKNPGNYFLALPLKLCPKIFNGAALHCLYGGKNIFLENDAFARTCYYL